ncbi:hypothetical protein RvY_00507 [Ramazzottius varieornatus]|uniref:RIIa domain-containing protein n=1 Tax=Ramazzottius varieornatus TaxID=947166 RepID=A0A1D1UH18_RAMVA|nr:hypothetical protein RvY_00507 [Ramazzottius varieornatus]
MEGARNRKPLGKTKSKEIDSRRNQPTDHNTTTSSSNREQLHSAAGNKDPASILDVRESPSADDSTCSTASDSRSYTSETPEFDISSSDADSTVQDGASDNVSEENWPEQSQEEYGSSFRDDKQNPTEFAPTEQKKQPLHDSTIALAGSNTDRSDVASVPRGASLGSAASDEELTVSPAQMEYAAKFKERVISSRNRQKGSQKDPLTPSNASMMSGPDYLEATVGPLLAQGLAEILKRRPKNPVEFLAAYLLADQLHIDKRSEGNLTSSPNGMTSDRDSSENLSTPLPKDRTNAAQNNKLGSTQSTPNPNQSKPRIQEEPRKRKQSVKRASQNALKPMR